MTITEMKKKFVAAGVDEIADYNWFYCIFTENLSKLEICEAILASYETEFLFIHRDEQNSFIGVDNTVTLDESFSDKCTTVYSIEQDDPIVEEETP